MYQIELISHDKSEGALLLTETTDIPKPDYKEILIKVSHASVNPIDCRVSEGYGWAIFAEAKGLKLPIVLGRDFAGEVISCGEGISSLKPKDKVWGAIDPFRKEGFKHGAHSQYIKVSEEEVIKAPGGLSAMEAASMPYVFLTTWNALFRVASLSPEQLKGKRVFINGGSGGVGSMAIQLLKSWNAKVMTSCSSKNSAYVKSLGADEVWEYDQGTDSYMRGQADVVYNLVPDDASQKAALSTLKRVTLDKKEIRKIMQVQLACRAELENMGSGAELEDYKTIIRRFDLGVADIAFGKPAYISIVSPMMKLTNQMGFHSGMREYVCSVLETKIRELMTNGRCYHYGFFAADKAGLTELNRLVELGELRPQVSANYPIKQVAAAFKQVGSGHTKGKVVLEMTGF